METKPKTLEEKRNDQIVSDALRLKSMVGLSLSNEECQRFIKGIYNEAAELYAGQTKKSELEKYWKHRCKLAENVIENSEAYDDYLAFLAGKQIPETDIRDDKAAIIQKQSSSVSLEVEEFEFDVNMLSKKDRLTFMHLISQGVRVKSIQSKQPVSTIAWLSDEDVEKECYKRDLSPSHVQIFESACDFIQSELRKRVIDPVQFLRYVTEETHFKPTGNVNEFKALHLSDGWVYITSEQLLEDYIDHLTSKKK